MNGQQNCATRKAEQGLNKRGIDSWKDEIREIVDDAKKQARTPEDFSQHLKKYGISMTERGKDKRLRTSTRTAEK